MKVFGGHPMMGSEVAIEGQSVQFKTEDGRTIFQVSVSKDGASIEVRAVDTWKHGETIYDTRLLIRPVVSNCVVISTMEYAK